MLIPRCRRVDECLYILHVAILTPRGGEANSAHERVLYAHGRVLTNGRIPIVIRRERSPGPHHVTVRNTRPVRAVHVKAGKWRPAWPTPKLRIASEQTEHEVEEHADGAIADEHDPRARLQESAASRMRAAREGDAAACRTGVDEGSWSGRSGGGAVPSRVAREGPTHRAPALAE